MKKPWTAILNCKTEKSFKTLDEAKQWLNACQPQYRDRFVVRGFVVRHNTK